MTSLPDKVAIIAGAGTGKSRLLRDLALSTESNQNVLYLTFTESNAFEFAESIRIERGLIPSNVTIMTWFSFLLVHGVRPFPPQSIPERIDRCYLSNGRISPKRGVRKGDHDYYCNAVGSAHTARLSELALACDKEWGGEVLNRIVCHFSIILVDEAQDFSGSDYDLILELMTLAQRMVVVGDPRQITYRTGHEAKYRGKSLFEFIADKGACKVDCDSLAISYRCPEEIIALANRLYAGVYPDVHSAVSGERGGRIRTLKKTEVLEYCEGRSCVALALSRATCIPDGVNRMTMGASKGLTIPDVIIYPSGDMKKWVAGREVELKPQTRAKLYVAITRASNSLAFVTG